MTAARRWWCVGIGVLLLLAAPMVVRALPAGDESVGATALLHRIEGSRHTSFTGYVESGGTVGLPANDALSGLSALLGATNHVRVWWRDPTTWRVATLRTTGETDLVHSGDRMLRWVYESKNVTLIPDVPVRLPDTADLLPNELARRVLEDARPGELSRLPAQRVAGHDALGLRLTPADPQSSIGHVDVYADRATGLPVQVQVYGRGSAHPSLTSRFIDLTVGRPPASALSFTPPHDSEVRQDEAVDLADAANRYASEVPPRSLAGLPSRSVPIGSERGAVGVYGRGPTVLLAVPIWSRYADRVREDLARQPGARTLPLGIRVAAPPLRLLLTEPTAGGSTWLLLGTVTRAALDAAARQLVGR